MIVGEADRRVEIKGFLMAGAPEIMIPGINAVS